jgi:hypothetical protein
MLVQPVQVALVVEAATVRQWLPLVTTLRDRWDAHQLGYGPAPDGPSRDAVRELRDVLLTALAAEESQATYLAAA